MLKRLVEWYLDVPPAEPGQGTAWHFNAESPWPTWLPDWVLLLLGLAMAVYVIGIYWRDATTAPRWMRLLLAGMRLAVIALVVLFLSGLTLSVDRTGLPSVVVFVDDSASMSLEDEYADEAIRNAVNELWQPSSKEDRPSRFNLARQVLLEDEGRFLKELASRQTLRIYRFSETATPVGRGEYRRDKELDELLPLLAALDANGTETRPGPAVRKVLNDLRGTPPSAVIIFTDGITSTTDADKLSMAAELALARLVPIYPVAIGSEEPARDLNLYDLMVDEVALVDDPVRFTAKLKGFGYTGKSVRVTLTSQHSNDVLADVDVRVAADGRPVDVELTYTPPLPGEFDFTLEAAVQPQERNADNNAQTRHVSVREEKIRVLLAESQPRYEFRYVKHLLERDKTIQLDTVLQDADLDYAREDATALEHFPVKREDLLRYDAIIFGDVAPDFLSTGVLENLRDFVRDAGGGLLFVAGPLHDPLSYRGTPLELLLPISLDGVSIPQEDQPIVDGFRPKLTLEGRKGTTIFRFAETERESQQVWQQLPELYWLCEAPVLKPGARVFAEHPVRTGADGRLPVVVMQPYGAGKVLFHATDELWRWRFRVGDLYYGRYWVQAVRYLSRSKLLGQDRTAELTASRAVYQRGESVQLRLRFLDERLIPTEADGVRVMVERRGGSQQAVALKRLPEAPTVFEGQLSRIRDGAYHAFVIAPSFQEASPTTEFRVEAPRQELERRSLDRADLQQTAKATRGRYYTLADVGQLPVDLPPGRAVPLETGDPLPLWNRWEMLLLFVLLLAGEWLLRKKYRLV